MKKALRLAVALTVILGLLCVVTPSYAGDKAECSKDKAACCDKANKGECKDKQSATSSSEKKSKKVSSDKKKEG